ncbi:hypothetical protein CEK71_18010 [Methylovulum psychrotolerans]|uniref:Uncharacterized protein n=1 Tax=Methylovulum psychrotolerans TaxID=1704499 RepID=A0A1Z4C2P4_9GAMM|nr:hypothetical protein CEK71_18010 [Methylovulum psychrotolerans]
MIIGYCKNDHLEWKTNGLSSGIQKKTAFSDERTGPDHPGSRRNLSRSVLYFCPSSGDNTSATAVRLHERATTMPKLHNAKPNASGLLRDGKCMAIVSIHWYKAKAQ